MLRVFQDSNRCVPEFKAEGAHQRTTVVTAVSHCCSDGNLQLPSTAKEAWMADMHLCAGIKKGLHLHTTRL